MVMHHREPEYLSKRLVCCSLGHSQGSYNQNMTFWYIFWTADPFATKLGLMAHHHKVDCLVKRLDCCFWSRSRSQKRCRIPVNVHLDDISSSAQPSVTKLGMVIQHHEPKCYARKFVSCLQVQGHSEGSYNQIWLFLSYLLNCWSFCNQILLDGTLL